MIISEEKAKQTTCPETFAVAGISGERSIGQNCIGTGCMAWRWFDSSGRTDRRGYCGKAGMPVFA